MNKEARAWHKSVKKLTNYTKPSTIIDLEQGPVAIREQWKQANQKIIPWEEVRVTRDKEEIEEQ